MSIARRFEIQTYRLCDDNGPIKWDKSVLFFSTSFIFARRKMNGREKRC